MSTPQELAEQAAERIRELNHLTLKGRPVPLDEIYVSVGHLESLARRLEQACTQLSAALLAEHERGHLYVPRGNTRSRVAVASVALYDASNSAVALQEPLCRAHVALGSLGAVPDTNPA